MKLAFSFCFFFFVNSSFGCEFKKNVNLINLSGPMTVLLKEFNLLGSPQLKGLSSVFNLDLNGFKGEIFSGGIFLSKSSWKKIKNPFVVFDQSYELEKDLNQSHVPNIKVVTRDLDPFLAHQEVAKVFLKITDQCEDKIKKLDSEIDNISKRLINTSKNLGLHIFFLGRIGKDKKFPELVINDNIVLYLKKLNWIETYKSQLAYIPWSSKILSSLKKDTKFIGLSDKSQETKLYAQIIEKNYLNLFHPQMHIPGLSQIRLLEPILSELSLIH